MNDLDAVVHDAREVVTVAADGELDVHEDAAVAVEDGRVAAVGPTDEVTREHPPGNATHAVDAEGGTVLPGFVDPHTHAVFAGDRSDEFAEKLRGKPYQEILAEGGGILRTVRAVRAASDRELIDQLLDHLDAMVAHGTTTVEVKSGYGLDVETELRLLEAIAAADQRHPVDVVPTFMGAHAVPEEKDPADYIDEVVDVQLPAVADQGVAAFCDVFCEEGVFDVDQSRRVLDAGAAHGLTPKVHAEEFTRLGGAQLAAEVGAASADHLLHANPDDAAALAESGTIPVFLPGTAFGLGADYADPEPFQAAGCPVALATDFNPNCFARSMGFAVTLGCVGMGLAPADAIVAATRNAALALEPAVSGDRAVGAAAGPGPSRTATDGGGQSDGPPTAGLGTLRAGAPADLQVLCVPSHVHVPYRFDTNPVVAVVKDGAVVHRAGAGGTEVGRGD